MNKPKKLHCISYKGDIIGVFQGFKELCDQANLPYNTLTKKDRPINYGPYKIETVNFREIKKH